MLKKSADVHALWRKWRRSSFICSFLKSICVKIWSITPKIHDINKECFLWKWKKCKTAILNLLSVFFSRQIRDKTNGKTALYRECEKSIAITQITQNHSSLKVGICHLEKASIWIRNYCNERLTWQWGISQCKNNEVCSETTFLWQKDTKNKTNPAKRIIFGNSWAM